MVVLNDNEIESICLNTVNQVNIKFPIYRPHIHILYKTGCRVNEVFNNRIALDLNEENILITPQKKNNLRVIPITPDININLVKELINKQELTYLNKRNLQRVIEKVSLIYPLYVGRKQTSAHIFRHNYIRKLHSTGVTIEEINRILGYTTQTVANTYLQSTIYTL